MGSSGAGIKPYIDVILGVIGILAAIRSAVQGWIHRYIYKPIIYDKFIYRLQVAEDAHERTQRIDDKLTDIDQKLTDLEVQNERQIDAMIALGQAVDNPDSEFDTDQLREEHDRDGVDDFVADD